MTTILSRPKEKIKILLLEGISDIAVAALNAAGYTNVDLRKTSLEGEELRAALDGVSMLGIRSRTQLTPEVLDGLRSVIAVGCFSVGTNQVDLGPARDMGIPVFNAPFSNTRSVAELTIAEIVMLLRRHLPEIGARRIRAAGTNRRPDRMEVRGKTLGIIGYGNIGSQLSGLAEAMGMRVIYLRSERPAATAAMCARRHARHLLAESDVVSLHVPETPETKGLIGAAEIRAR